MRNADWDRKRGRKGNVKKKNERSLIEATKSLWLRVAPFC